MTIGEARAVNDLLEYFLRHPNSMAVSARNAAVLLAQHARATLRAGLDGSDVEVFWRDLEDLIEDAVLEEMEEAA